MTRRPSTLAAALAAGLLSLALGVGCGGQEGADDGSVKEAPGTAATTADSETPKGPRKQPTKVEEIVALFPKDLPKWDKATLTDAVGGLDGEGVQTLDSDEAPEVAAGFYRDQLEALGWDLATEKSVEDFTMLEFKRGDEILTVLVEPNERGGTQVNLVNR